MKALHFFEVINIHALYFVRASGVVAYVYAEGACGKVMVNTVVPLSLAAAMVPPQEVDVSAREVGSRAALPHVQFKPAPLGVCGRRNEEVAKSFVGRVPYQRVNAVAV